MFLKKFGLSKNHLQEIIMIEKFLKKKFINFIDNIGSVAQYLTSSYLTKVC